MTDTEGATMKKIDLGVGCRHCRHTAKDGQRRFLAFLAASLLCAVGIGALGFWHPEDRDTFRPREYCWRKSSELDPRAFTREMWVSTPWTCRKIYPFLHPGNPVPRDGYYQVRGEF